jgi:hypothetical protein
MKKLFYFSLLLATLAGCSSSNQAYSPVTGFDYNRGGNQAAERFVSAPDGTPPFNSRMVIYDASIGLAVRKPDSLNRQLVNIASANGGYALNLGSGFSTIRVKADQLNTALKEISMLGKVTSKNITGSDITEQYHDVEIRLDNARKARERYLDLLSRAENVEAALKVEKELERLNGEIDLLEGKKNRMEHLNTYSTINVYYHEKKKPGILGYIGIGLYKSVKWLFVRN